MHLALHRSLVTVPPRRAACLRPAACHRARRACRLTLTLVRSCHVCCPHRRRTPVRRRHIPRPFAHRTHPRSPLCHPVCRLVAGCRHRHCKHLLWHHPHLGPGRLALGLIHRCAGRHSGGIPGQGHVRLAAPQVGWGGLWLCGCAAAGLGWLVAARLCCSRAGSWLRGLCRGWWLRSVCCRWGVWERSSDGRARSLACR